MTMPRPQQWTETEVNRLRMFAKRKVGSDKIAKSLGRYAAKFDRFAVPVNRRKLLPDRKIFRPSQRYSQPPLLRS